MMNGSAMSHLTSNARSTPLYSRSQFWPHPSRNATISRHSRHVAAHASKGGVKWQLASMAKKQQQQRLPQLLESMTAAGGTALLSLTTLAGVGGILGEGITVLRDGTTASTHLCHGFHHSMSFSPCPFKLCDYVQHLASRFREHGPGWAGWHCECSGNPCSHRCFS